MVLTLGHYYSLAMMESQGDDLTSYGSRAVGPESSEEISLVQDLERELGAIVQRHRIPPDELQQLFEVCIELHASI